MRFAKGAQGGRPAGKVWLSAIVGLACFVVSHDLVTAADPLDVIQRIKGSIVAVGTYEKSRTPAFAFLGTGFAVGDGSLVTTNAHVLPRILDDEHRELLVIVIPGATPAAPAQIRTAKTFAIDQEHDLALVRIEGPKLPALVLGDSSRVREGQQLSADRFSYWGCPRCGPGDAPCPDLGYDPDRDPHRQCQSARFALDQAPGDYPLSGDAARWHSLPRKQWQPAIRFRHR